MQEEYLCDEIKLKDLIIKEIDTYKQKIEDIKEKAKEMKIQPYYGNEDFIKYRISFIIQCIEKMLNKPRFKDRKDIQKHYEYVKKIYRDCKEITLDIDSIEEQKINYEKLENLYLKVLEIENILSKDVEQVWKETMKEKNSKEGQMAYFAHSLTEGEFNPEDMNKVCVTYVTEKTLTIPYGDYGFLYEMDMDNIIQIAAEDAGSWKVDKEKFIDNDLSTFWQFEEPIDEEGNRIFFEYPPRNSKLLLPDDVEQETINENIQRNGEMLDYDKRNVYNEAVIINKNKKMMPIGVFVKIIGNEENSDKMQKAKALSEKFGLELKIFDKSVLRERLGLKPLTEGEMKKGSKEKEF